MDEDQRPRRDTRTAIIEAAMQGFGEKGFEATSIREIAALAGSNIASISYHFGGKEGLRAACAEHIVRILSAVLQTAGADDVPADRDEARAMLAAMVRNMVSFLLLQPQARLVAGFILREMAQPSSALDVIYDGLFIHVHRRACAIWAAATGQEAESEAVRLAVFAAVGQVVYFHVGRPIIERRMGWAAIGSGEAQAVAETVTRSLLARLDADSRP